MPLDFAKARQFIAEFNLKRLFIEELCWNHYESRLVVSVDGQQFILNAFAEKQGLAAFICDPQTDGSYPDYSTRLKIERQVAKSIYEHIIVYTDEKNSFQIWQWVKRVKSKPAACREHSYRKGQSGESLIQKLQNLAVNIEDEETLTLTAVTGRARKAFDVERVTKRFYDRFQTEHFSFLSFLKGIPDNEMQRWYVSVMLNRLMFIYFIQKKGFLDNNPDYLRHKLAQSQSCGKNLFYRDFLCPLFFQGFSKKKEERSVAARNLFGEVPYLNGGIFMPHQIEQLHGRDIVIDDQAFEKLFDFFECYQWHLDERPLRNDNEINPDVLGYIFEKYINQKQMGAYYTKEDITDYISKNTIIPFLFDSAKEHCKVAFEGEHSVWKLLQENPDRYIYNAVKHGITVNIHEKPLKPLEKPLELPEEIAAGLNDVSKRGGWNRPAPAEFALPTEIWRELVSRRRRYQEVHDRMTSGEVQSINDLITYNLDIRQFAQDVIESCEGPELLTSFWHAIEKVTVLDPTCGSGAFLFAALNILEPLYEECLEKMEFFLAEWGEEARKNHPNYFKLFSETLNRVSLHPDRRYFILKSIIVNNLYGVDIMEEATEICKLRLFLKLIAQIDNYEEIEPLPDIDFNIRAGNTLVGFSSKEEVRKAFSEEGEQRSMIFGEEEEELRKFEIAVADAQQFYERFREYQLTGDGIIPAEHKQELCRRFKELEEKLNRLLAVQYSISKGDFNSNDTYEIRYKNWLNSHKPFHWFVEFYGIIKNGGFDVIIGNPPYVEYSKVKSEYSVQNYQTERCGNIYAYTIERSLIVLKSKGLISLIVPLSLMSTERMSSLQSLLLKEKRTLWLSAFDVYPCKLFEGSKQRLTIFIASAQMKDKSLFTSRYNRWKPEERNNLLPNLVFWPSFIDSALSAIPKIGNALIDSILKKIRHFKAALFVNDGAQVSFYVHRIPYNYVKAFDFFPYFYNEIDGEKKSEDYKPYYLHDSKKSKIMLAVLNSNLFFWWWYTFFEGYHCGKHEIHSFPAGLDRMTDEAQKQLIELADTLMTDLKKNKNRKSCSYKNTGKVLYDEFYPSKSKDIIDQIDSILIKHYGISYDASDYIINYDIKYRSNKDNN